MSLCSVRDEEGAVVIPSQSEQQYQHHHGNRSGSCRQHGASRHHTAHAVHAPGTGTCQAHRGHMPPLCIVGGMPPRFGFWGTGALVCPYGTCAVHDAGTCAPPQGKTVCRVGTWVHVPQCLSVHVPPCTVTACPMTMMLLHDDADCCTDAMMHAP